MSEQADKGESVGAIMHPAFVNLTESQRQLDADGCEVGVSRQALDETLALCDTLFERLQAIIDWADLALRLPGEFNSHGVRNLDGPVFDEARAAISRARGGR